MTDKKLGMLAVCAAALLVITVILYSTESTKTNSVKTGTLLVQGLDPALVNAIVVKTDKDSLTLKKSGDGNFVIEERDDYPASVKQINELIKNICDIRCGELITDSAKNHAELGVAEGAENSSTVSFLGADGKLLVGIVKGKSASTISGSYVRLLGEDKVYASEDYLSFNTSATDYIEKSPLDVKREDIQEVVVDVKDNDPYKIKRDDKNIVLENIPKGKRAKGKDYEQVFHALAGLYVEDVKSERGTKVEWDSTYKCKVKGELTYTVKVGKIGEKSYIKMQAFAPPPKKVTVQEVQNASEEATKEKDEMFKAADKVQEFNPAHSGWIYEVNKWQAENLRKLFTALIEDIPAADEPEEIAASHILIPFKDVDKNSKHTKKEAKKLIEDVLKKAKAKGADFAALAKKYSEGPTNKRGGDLGTFKRGKMAKPFEDAAFKLKVDEVSGVVETEFGFHIIKRTK